MDYSFADPGPLVVVNGAMSGTLSPGGMVSLATAFSCESFSVGSNATATSVEGEDVPTSLSVGSVAVSWDINVLAPIPDPGQFAFSPAGNPTRTKTHTVGSSPCPDPFSAFVITNVGGSPINYMFTSVPSFLVPPMQPSGTLAPGQTRSVNTSFSCDNFNMGMNNAALVIETVDSETSDPTGSGQVNYQLNVVN